MESENKTEEQFVHELEKLRQRIVALEHSSKKIQRSISPRFLYIVIPLLFLISVACILLVFFFLIPEKQKASPLSTKAKKATFFEAKHDTLHTLELITEDTTWVFVKIDDRESKEMILKPGERIKWTAKNNFWLKIGNAGGTKLIFDGKEIGPIGEKGQVVKLKFPFSKTSKNKQRY